MRFRRFFPFLVGIVILAASIMLWNALYKGDQAHELRYLKLKADSVKHEINSKMTSRILALVRMARRLEDKGMPSQAEWEADARLYVEHYAGYQGIAWVDPGFKVRWVVPGGGNGEVVGRNLGFEPERLRALNAARERRDAAFTGQVDLVTGGRGFLACVPVFHRGELSGFIVGAFKSQELLADILQSVVHFGGYSISVLNGQEEIYNNSGAHGAASVEYSQEEKLDLFGATWVLRVGQGREDSLVEGSYLPWVVLLCGAFLGLALGSSVYFAQKSASREKEANRANRELALEVAERKRAQEEATTHASELTRSNAELEQFAYVASHDLQEPLRIVSGYVQLLQKRYAGKLDSNADEFISFAVDACGRMQRLISDLLAYSRVGREKEFGEVGCGSIFSAALQSLKAVIDESGASVTSDPMPTVRGDASQLEHLFLNLIGNAIKYRGASAPEVHVSALLKNSEWQFSVRDNGLGIDPKYHDRIFVIFQRLHGKGQYSGTGIGLAICKKVVENHKGKIWVESEQGAGSTFHFTIPN